MLPLKRVLILVENLPSPFDRRVWQEACALRDAGYVVSIICPTGRGYERKFEAIDGIHIYRYNLPIEASGGHAQFEWRLRLRRAGRASRRHWHSAGREPERHHRHV